jgi:hypothetical protein
MMILSFLEVGTVWFWGLLFLSAIVVSSLVDDDRFCSATVVALGTMALLALLGNFNPLMLVRDHPREALLAIPAYLTVGVFWCYLKWTLFVGAAARKTEQAAASFRETVGTRKSELDREERDLAAKKLALSRNAEPIEHNGARRPEHGVDSPYQYGRHCRGEETPAEQLHTLEGEVRKLEAKRERMQSEDWRHEIWMSALSSVGLRDNPKPMVRDNKTRCISWMAYWPASMAWTLVDDPVRRAFVALYDSIGGSLQHISDRRFAGIEDTYKASPGKGER